ncbi:MAG: DNA adenine methylase [Anaerolineae bacterium]
MIKYIGSKRVLVPAITALVQALPDVHTVLDLLSGTSRVGHALKRAGYAVTANDHTSYAYTLARCYVQADADALLPETLRVLDALARVEPRDGWFTETYCRRSRYFHPKNGARIEAMREAIDAWGLDGDLRAVVLTALMEAADRVDSTVGVQMAYLKAWAPRAHNDLELRVPEVLPGPGLATQLEALDAAKEHSADLVYLDPPYNQHRYLANYHVWETLVRWDQPEVYGVACKRIDCKDYHSSFNSRREIHAAMRTVVEAAQARYLLVSFNNEGYITRREMEILLAEHGHVRVLTRDHDRYVGARIGIYNPDGDKVGKISHVRNKEYLYLVGREESVLDQAIEAVAAPATQPTLF